MRRGKRAVLAAAALAFLTTAWTGRTSASDPVHDGDAVREELRRLLAEGAPGVGCAPPPRSDDVRRFYDARAGLPAWVASGAATARARRVAAALESAELKGLRAEDYGGPGWAARIEELSRGPSSPALAARFDLSLTRCALRYASDLQYGRISPRQVHLELLLRHEGELEPLEFLRRASGDADLEAALRDLEPSFPGYERTLRALERYLELARAHPRAHLPSPARPVRAGERYSGAPELARLLRALGDLAEGTRSGEAGVFDAPLVQAVRRFQARHGLEPNGRLDPATLGALDVPLARRAAQLALTLERWRWLPHRFASAPVVVNIPEFRLYARDPARGDHVSMRVVVGSVFRSQTPVFAAEMTSILFRPAWHVPASIQRDEIVPRLERDAGYLERGAYEAVDRRGVAAEGTDRAELLRRLRAGDLRLRQRPGPHNALGLVKFVLPNAHDVYLHGTPAQDLFRRARRDFSHGCIRLEDPVELARWTLREAPGWTPERIRAAMDGPSSSRVDLPRPIPVLVVYGTAVVAEDGEVRFLPDLYGHDAALERALRTRAASR